MEYMLGKTHCSLDLPQLPSAVRTPRSSQAPSWLVLSPVARERINMRVHGLTPKDHQVVFRFEDLRFSEVHAPPSKPHHVLQRRASRKTPTLRKAGAPLAALKLPKSQKSSKELTLHSGEAQSPAVRAVESVETRRKVPQAAVLTPTAWTPDNSGFNL